MSFKDLGLLPELLKAIDEKGYKAPTPIQQQAIPLILEGSDLMASAQTGTGKTAGFILPMLHRLMENFKNHKRGTLQALILTPTRELAAQVEDNLKTYGKYLPLKSTAIFGGVNMKPQIKNIRNGVDIVVATPGRLLDHVNQKTINLSKIGILILDEADRMLDMGFIPDIRKILALLSEDRQSLLFSATFSNEIKNLTSSFLKAPKILETARHNTPAECVSQTIYPVDHNRKRSLLSFLISSQKWKRVLVFTRTKHGADKLAKQLVTDGIPSAAIHGDKSQSARTKTLMSFKQNSIRVLVATDIAARGLDIDHLPHVVNFELPTVPEDYVHRIGRTGRAGNKGESISLVSIDEHKLLRDIERFLKMKIPSMTIAGYEPDPSLKAPSLSNGRNQQFRKSPKRNFRHKSKRPGAPNRKAFRPK
jgi:ATP-dependent RNA helicase RhlE